MAAGDEQDLIEAVVTCEGNLHDPDFQDRFRSLIDKLKSALYISKTKDPFRVRKIEPWNSVRVTISIPKEAAQKLKLLAQQAQQGSNVLRSMGILSVQVEGDQVISLTWADNNNEATQVILRQTSDDQAAGSSGTSSGVSSSSLPASSPTISSISSSVASLSSPVPLTPGSSSSIGLTEASGIAVTLDMLASSSSSAFRSPNVVAPSGEALPVLPPKSSSATGIRPALGGPFPFVSMTHAAQAIHRSGELTPMLTSSSINNNSTVVSNSKAAAGGNSTNSLASTVPLVHGKPVQPSQSNLLPVTSSSPSSSCGAPLLVSTSSNNAHHVTGVSGVVNSESSSSSQVTRLIIENSSSSSSSSGGGVLSSLPNQVTSLGLSSSASVALSQAGPSQSLQLQLVNVPPPYPGVNPIISSNHSGLSNSSSTSVVGSSSSLFTSNNVQSSSRLLPHQQPPLNSGVVGGGARTLTSGLVEVPSTITTATAPVASLSDSTLLNHPVSSPLLVNLLQNNDNVSSPSSSNSQPPMLQKNASFPPLQASSIGEARYLLQQQVKKTKRGLSLDGASPLPSKPMSDLDPLQVIPGLHQSSSTSESFQFALPLPSSSLSSSSDSSMTLNRVTIPLSTQQGHNKQSHPSPHSAPVDPTNPAALLPGRTIVQGNIRILEPGSGQVRTIPLQQQQGLFLPPATPPPSGKPSGLHSHRPHHNQLSLARDQVTTLVNGPIPGPSLAEGDGDPSKSQLTRVTLLQPLEQQQLLEGGVTSRTMSTTMSALPAADQSRTLLPITTVNLVSKSSTSTVNSSGKDSSLSSSSDFKTFIPPPDPRLSQVQKAVSSLHSNSVSGKHSVASAAAGGASQGFNSDAKSSTSQSQLHPGAASRGGASMTPTPANLNKRVAKDNRPHHHHFHGPPPTGKPRQFLINPLTGHLEPMPSEMSGSESEGDDGTLAGGGANVEEGKKTNSHKGASQHLKNKQVVATGKGALLHRQIVTTETGVTVARVVKDSSSMGQLAQPMMMGKTGGSHLGGNADSPSANLASIVAVSKKPTRGDDSSSTNAALHIANQKESKDNNSPATTLTATAVTGEKIKLRLKLEKIEPISPAYKVDVSFVKKSEKGSVLTSSSSSSSSSLSSSSSSTASVSSLSAQASSSGNAASGGGSDQPRVPPLHISLRGKNAAVVVSPRREEKDIPPNAKDPLVNTRVDMDVFSSLFTPPSASSKSHLTNSHDSSLSIKSSGSKTGGVKRKSRKSLDSKGESNAVGKVKISRPKLSKELSRANSSPLESSSTSSLPSSTDNKDSSVLLTMPVLLPAVELPPPPPTIEVRKVKPTSTPVPVSAKPADNILSPFTTSITEGVAEKRVSVASEKPTSLPPPKPQSPPHLPDHKKTEPGAEEVLDSIFSSSIASREPPPIFSPSPSPPPHEEEVEKSSSTVEEAVADVVVEPIPLLEPSSTSTAEVAPTSCSSQSGDRDQLPHVVDQVFKGAFASEMSLPPKDEASGCGGGDAGFTTVTVPHETTTDVLKNDEEPTVVALSSESAAASNKDVSVVDEPVINLPGVTCDITTISENQNLREKELMTGFVDEGLATENPSAPPPHHNEESSSKVQVEQVSAGATTSNTTPMDVDEGGEKKCMAEMKPENVSVGEQNNAPEHSTIDFTEETQPIGEQLGGDISEDLKPKEEKEKSTVEVAAEGNGTQRNTESMDVDVPHEDHVSLEKSQVDIDRNSPLPQETTAESQTEADVTTLLELGQSKSIIEPEVDNIGDEIIGEPAVEIIPAPATAVLSPTVENENNEQVENVEEKLKESELVVKASTGMIPSELLTTTNDLATNQVVIHEEKQENSENENLHQPEKATPVGETKEKDEFNEEQASHPVVDDAGSEHLTDVVSEINDVQDTNIDNTGEMTNVASADLLVESKISDIDTLDESGVSENAENGSQNTSDIVSAKTVKEEDNIDKQESGENYKLEEKSEPLTIIPEKETSPVKEEDAAQSETQATELPNTNVLSPPTEANHTVEADETKPLSSSDFSKPEEISPVAVSKEEEEFDPDTSALSESPVVEPQETSCTVTEEVTKQEAMNEQPESASTASLAPDYSVSEADAPSNDGEQKELSTVVITSDEINAVAVNLEEPQIVDDSKSEVGDTDEDCAETSPAKPAEPEDTIEVSTLEEADIKEELISEGVEDSQTSSTEENGEVSVTITSSAAPVSPESTTKTNAIPAVEDVKSVETTASTPQLVSVTCTTTVSTPPRVETPARKKVSPQATTTSSTGVQVSEKVDVSYDETGQSSLVVSEVAPVSVTIMTPKMPELPAQTTNNPPISIVLPTESALRSSNPEGKIGKNTYKRRAEIKPGALQDTLKRLHDNFLPKVPKTVEKPQISDHMHQATANMVLAEVDGVEERQVTIVEPKQHHVKTTAQTVGISVSQVRPTSIIQRPKMSASTTTIHHPQLQPGVLANVSTVMTSAGLTPVLSVASSTLSAGGPASQTVFAIHPNVSIPANFAQLQQSPVVLPGGHKMVPIKLVTLPKQSGGQLQTIPLGNATPNRSSPNLLEAVNIVANAGSRSSSPKTTTLLGNAMQSTPLNLSSVSLPVGGNLHFVPISVSSAAGGTTGNVKVLMTQPIKMQQAGLSQSMVVKSVLMGNQPIRVIRPASLQDPITIQTLIQQPQGQGGLMSERLKVTQSAPSATVGSQSVTLKAEVLPSSALAAPVVVDSLFKKLDGVEIVDTGSPLNNDELPFEADIIHDEKDLADVLAAEAKNEVDSNCTNFHSDHLKMENVKSSSASSVSLGVSAVNAGSSATVQNHVGTKKSPSSVVHIRREEPITSISASDLPSPTPESLRVTPSLFTYSQVKEKVVHNSRSTSPAATADPNGPDLHGEDPEIINSFSRRSPLYQPQNSDSSSSNMELTNCDSKTLGQALSIEIPPMELVESVGPSSQNPPDEKRCTRSTRSNTRLSPDITAFSDTPAKPAKNLAVKVAGSGDTLSVKNSPKPSPTGSYKVLSPTPSSLTITPSTSTRSSPILHNQQHQMNAASNAAATINAVALGIIDKIQGNASGQKNSRLGKLASGGNKRKRQESDSSSASRDENSEEKAEIDLNSRPGKRKCSENAAEMIKVCIGVEDSPKRSSTGVKKADSEAKLLKDGKGKKTMAPVAEEDDDVDSEVSLSRGRSGRSSRESSEDRSSSRGSSAQRMITTDKAKSAKDADEATKDLKASRVNSRVGKETGAKSKNPADRLNPHNSSTPPAKKLKEAGKTPGRRGQNQANSKDKSPLTPAKTRTNVRKELNSTTATHQSSATIDKSSTMGSTPSAGNTPDNENARRKTRSSAAVESSESEISLVKRRRISKEANS